jgi:hypothetical protein
VVVAAGELTHRLTAQTSVRLIAEKESIFAHNFISAKFETQTTPPENRNQTPHPQRKMITKPQAKRSKPRTQSGAAVKDLKMGSSSFGTLEKYTPEKCDRDLKCLRKRTLHRMLHHQILSQHLHSSNSSLESSFCTNTGSTAATYPPPCSLSAPSKRRRQRRQSGEAVAHVSRENKHGWDVVKLSGMLEMHDRRIRTRLHLNLKHQDTARSFCASE